MLSSEPPPSVPKSSHAEWGPVSQSTGIPRDRVETRQTGFMGQPWDRQGMHTVLRKWQGSLRGAGIHQRHELGRLECWAGLDFRRAGRTLRSWKILIGPVSRSPSSCSRFHWIQAGSRNPSRQRGELRAAGWGPCQVPASSPASQGPGSLAVPGTPPRGSDEDAPGSTHAPSQAA